MLTLIFAISIFFWEEPSYGGGTVFYPEWAHGIGWFLIILAAIQIPIVGIVVIVHHARQGAVGDAFKPTAKWGPQGPKI